MRRFRPKPKPHIILMVGDEGILMTNHAMPTTSQPVFAHHDNKEGIEAIHAYIKAQSKTRITLVTDTMAQDFRRETMPQLNFLDRSHFIKRRLYQNFPQAHLKAHHRARTNRHYVFYSGLPETSPIFAWMKNLQSRHLRTVLLPIESADMVTCLLPQARDGWAMLVTRQRTGGFRQIVTHHGDIIFTRLTLPLPDDANAPALPDMLARDIRASLSYLQRLGLNNSMELHIAMVMPQDMHTHINALALPVHSITTYSPQVAARELQLDPNLPIDNSYCDLLFAGWIAKKRHLRLHLRPTQTHQSYHDTIQFWGLRFTMGLFAIALLITGLQATKLASVLLAQHQERNHIALEQDKLTAMQNAPGSRSDPHDRLRQALERQRLFSTPTTKPWPILQQFSASLDHQALLTKLNWQSDSDATTDQTMQVNVRLLALSDGMDHDAILHDYDQLAARLRAAMPDYTTTITRYPFPALPQESLGTTSDNPVTDLTAEFTVRKNAP